MSETVQQLTSRQVADLRRQLRERDAQGLASVLRNLPAPSLPRCPACDTEGERIDQRVEDPEFGVDETALRLRWLPCGHRFRAVVDPSAGPARPDEERFTLNNTAAKFTPREPLRPYYPHEEPTT